MKNIVQNTTEKIHQLLASMFVILIFAHTGFMQAQAPAIEWEKSFGGTGADYGQSVNQTTDGGYVMVGYSYSDDGDVTVHYGLLDFWVVKMDSTGNLEWQKSLGGSLDDYGQSIKQTEDGGYIVGGYTSSYNGDVSGVNGQIDCWAVKLDGSGNIQWQNAMGGNNQDYAKEIRQTSDGGYIMIGTVYSNNGDVSGNHGSSDYWVVKLSSSGTIQWQKALGGTFLDEGESIQQTSDGGYIVAGSSTSSDGDVTTGNQGLRDFWIVKLDGNGNIQWTNSMGGSATEYAQSIIQTADGGYIVCGDTLSNNGDVTGNHGYNDFWVVKLDALGAMEWQKTLGGSLQDQANSIQQTADGGFVIAGVTESNDGDVSGNDFSGNGNSAFWVVKLDNSGNVLWQKAMGIIGREEAESIALTVDGGYLIAGHNDFDYWVVKLEPEPLGIDEFDGNKIVLYPNPVQEVFTINTTQNGNYTLMTLNGQLLKKGLIVNGHNDIYIAALADGVYFINIKTAAGILIKKIIKM